MTEHDPQQTEKLLARIQEELSLSRPQVAGAARLLDEGATVPFIARYRKEATGGLDEVAILAVRDRLAALRDLEARRAAIVKSLEERQLLTPELAAAVQGAANMSALEDVYLPYKPKRRTRAMMAREKGLEPLALAVLAQEPGFDPMDAAQAYVDAEQGVSDADEALGGARDIIAELVNEDASTRAEMRAFYADKSVLASKVVSGQEEAGAKFRDYFDWSEPAAAAPSHRILAMRRGEKEGFLYLRLAPDKEAALALLERRWLKGESPAAEQVRLALADGYARLLGPSLETELRLELKKRADLEAVKVFAANLRELLMAPPLGQKRVLAVDPGFRTGCKIACLDAQGRLLHHGVFLLMTDRQRQEAMAQLQAAVKEYRMEAVAIGNGTASREAEAVAREAGLGVPVVMVSEAGASVYSASETARKEFPDLDVSVRGAVSIGRRLIDPLAELVKIDPKSIGVGQYQHDVDQKALVESLEDVVVSCVNAVGVEVNTASPELLAHVSGLGPSLAAGVVAHREANGPFASRADLMRVPRLGPKAFEQAAGFLRIQGGDDPLDASAVHPESYPLVQAMAADLGCAVADLMQDAALRGRIDAKRYVSDAVGLPTINDILGELAKPGRDPREAFSVFSFQEGVETIDDLEQGMRLPGVVTNVTNFGAFVDIGVHRDGLVHISHLADRYVSDPNQVVKVQQKVEVTVLEVDRQRERISLSMRADPFAAPGRAAGGDAPRDEGRPRKPRGGGKGGGRKGKPAPAPAAKPGGVFNDALAQSLKGLKID